VRLRPARARDAAAMTRLHAESFPRAWSESEMAGLLSAPRGTGFVAEHAGTAAGFVLARRAADEAEILTIAVAAAHRRQRLGWALLAAAEAACASAGASRMVLDVSETNAAARGFYAAAGYAERARRPGYYADGAAALILDKQLS